ncbi:MAG TPA: hypothetical protein VNJ03_04805 [Vicinamibacterales bacterium]|nr:hypothetical protein [Vicinamibacterales bacterium]
MTARSAAAIASLALLSATGCTNFYEVPIETPIQAKLDVSAFRRVLVAGFISGGSDDVDANMETVRLLRSQLRSKTNLRIIEAEPLPLVQLAGEQAAKTAAAPAATPAPETPATPGALPATPPAAPAGEEAKSPTSKEGSTVRTKKDLEKFDRIFADAAFWKKLGEEYESPLIVTGTVMFTPQQTSGFVNEQREVYDQLGRRQVIPTRTYKERKGFVLEPKFVFIDGRTGATIYSETYRREVLYSSQQTTPALASYFELMDQLLPDFLGALSTQKIRGTRILLR